MEEHLAELKELGEVVVYTDTTKANYAERLAGADVAVIDCFLAPINKEFLSNVPDLKFFSINSTGFDNVDVAALKEVGVIASDVPEFSTNAVAEHAIGLMFAAVRKITQGDCEFRAGLRVVDPGTPEADRFMGFDLVGKTLGVVGLGNIGTRIAAIGNGIGMKVVGYNRTKKTIPNVKTVSLEQLMGRADVVVIAMAFSDETEGMISKELLAKMKTSAVLVNIARMGIVDEDALIQALNSEAIAGAGIDVGGDKYTQVKNAVLTPHIAYNIREASENMGRIIVENIKAYAAGQPVNVIQ